MAKAARAHAAFAGSRPDRAPRRARDRAVRDHAPPPRRRLRRWLRLVPEGPGPARELIPAGVRQVDVTQRVATALACSALDPSLAGLLLLDLDPALIYPLARWLKELLKTDRRGHSRQWDGPPLIPLGPHDGRGHAVGTVHAGHCDRRERPEDLGFRWDPAGWPATAIRPGAGHRGGARPGGLGLPAARAAITLLDADVAHLERSGVPEMWRPRDRWLAALRREEGEVHLGLGASARPLRPPGGRQGPGTALDPGPRPGTAVGS